jgi:signal transduction histidine kinase
LPGFIAMLSEHLGAEQQVLIENMESLQKNVDHIKEIVAMQQNYARVVGVVETVAPASLVEDAFRIHASSLEQHRIEVVREFALMPPVSLDKHKVLQILVNLIANARDALRECDGPKRLSLCINQTTTNTVKFQISDSGGGIAPENLVKIFQHGFTTKPTGHGFGLHSGANAAREMGGCLSVQSDGAGRGATFTLELPMDPAQRLPQAA